MYEWWLNPLIVLRVWNRNKDAFDARPNTHTTICSFFFMSKRSFDMRERAYRDKFEQ
jgi:hypothetical protein